MSSEIHTLCNRTAARPSQSVFVVRRIGWKVAARSNVCFRQLMSAPLGARALTNRYVAGEF